MDMIAHNDELVGFEAAELVGGVVDRVDNQLGDFFLREPRRAECGLVQKGIRSLKGRIGGDYSLRQGSLQAEGDERRMVEQVDVRKAAAVKGYSYLLVCFQRDFSQEYLFRNGVLENSVENLSGFGRGPETRATRADRVLEKQAGPERGVTLLEMLVVVGIVAILMGVSYPSIAASVDSVRLATAADSTAAFLNSALNRAEQRHQVLELTIGKRKNEIALRSADPTFVRRLEYPAGVRIAEILPSNLLGEEEARVFYLIPGGAAPRVGVQLVNARGAKRTVRVDPITGAPEIVRE